MNDLYIAYVGISNAIFVHCEERITHFFHVYTTILLFVPLDLKNGRTTKKVKKEEKKRFSKQNLPNRKYYWAQYCYGILHTIGSKRVGLNLSHFSVFLSLSKHSRQVVRWYDVKNECQPEIKRYRIKCESQKTTAKSGTHANMLLWHIGTHTNCQIFKIGSNRMMLLINLSILSIWTGGGLPYRRLCCCLIKSTKSNGWLKLWFINGLVKLKSDWKSVCGDWSGMSLELNEDSCANIKGS